MNLRLYEPSALLGQLHQDLGRIFDTPWGGLSDLASAENSWSPPVDIKEDENHYYIKADVPGVDSKDIEITLERGVLTISGSRQMESKEEANGYRRVERFRGRFTRAFSLPDTADADNVDATVKNGVLEVTINKKESSKPRRISVRS